MNKILYLIVLTLVSFSLFSKDYVVINPYAGFYNEKGRLGDEIDSLEDYDLDLTTYGLGVNGFATITQGSPIKFVYNLNFGLPYKVSIETDSYSRTKGIDAINEFGIEMSMLGGIGYLKSFGIIDFYVGLGLAGTLVSYELSYTEQGSLMTFGGGGALQLLYKINESFGVALGATGFFTPFYFSRTLVDGSPDNYALTNWSPYLGIASTF